MLPLLFALLIPLALSATPPGENAILLSNVHAINLRGDRQTTSRRVPAIPQLHCAGPSKICNLYHVEQMHCTNLGSDAEDGKENVEWACNAALPPEFKLGATDVVCEGYRDADDEWVLKGSCGVEYRLLLTESGHERYREKIQSMRQDSSWSELVGFLVVVLTFGALFYIVWLFIMACLRGDGGQGGAGGGRRDDHDDDDDPPPPYSSYPNGSSGQQHQPGGDLNLARNMHRNRGGYDPGQGSSSAPLSATSSSTGFGSTRRR
ncbi:uncharacterized protein PFLUO_LOCUS2508 [Penicillium psychrofluorescens]|uniref:uncharacterized protein n=1 Tax=Penicillium psychrofluorescens TaxID=3158075 RepID=UPI003CCD8F91